MFDAYLCNTLEADQERKIHLYEPNLSCQDYEASIGLILDTGTQKHEFSVQDLLMPGTQILYMHRRILEFANLTLIRACHKTDPRTTKDDGRPGPVVLPIQEL